MEITKVIYNLTTRKEFNKDFSLKDQVRRSIISVSSNIVEGFEKSSTNEFIRFLKIAKGSVGEVRNQLYIALNIGYVNKNEFDNINNKLEELANQIGGFIKYLIQFKKQKSVIQNS